MQQFASGSRVSWTSQASGGLKRKEGIIVAVIPAGAEGVRRVRAEIDRRLKAGTHRSAFGGGCDRDHTSYLIEVVVGGSKATKCLYWPVVSKLEHQADA